MRRRNNCPFRLAVAGLCLTSIAMLSGCGSTVAGTQSGAPGAPSSGLSMSAGGASEGAPGSGLAPSGLGVGQGANSTATGGVTTGYAPRAAADSSGSTPNVATAKTAPDASALPQGMTSTAVKIGLWQVSTQALNAFANSVGANAAVGDADGWQNALISWVNKHGGLAHRTLTPVYYQASVSASNETNNAAACAAWTQDNHVYLANSYVNEGGGAVPCLRNAGVISVGGTYEVGSAEDFARYAPYYYSPSSMETISIARSYVIGLHNAGFFKPADKIGLLYFDYPEYRVAISDGLQPTLASYHLKLTDQRSIYYGGNPSELGNISAAVSNAELKFVSEGIKDVLFLDSGGTIGLFYMENAQQQHRSFRYGFNSTSDGSFLEGQNGLAPQLANSMISGTKPAYDTNELSTAPANPDRDRCFAILRAAGFTPGSAVDREAMLDMCAFFFFVRAAFDAASAYSPQGFAQAVARLGSHPGSGSASDGDSFRVGKPWGASAYAIAAWNTRCSCFRYTGGAHTF